MKIFFKGNVSNTLSDTRKRQIPLF